MIKKGLIYLSRSNEADPEIFSFVKRCFEELGFEINYFSGGKYDLNEVKKCDALYIVPPASNYEKVSAGNAHELVPKGVMFIGRGQYEQSVAMQNEEKPVFLLSSFKTNGINHHFYSELLERYNFTRTNGDTDWTKSAAISRPGDEFPLKEFEPTFNYEVGKKNWKKPKIQPGSGILCQMSPIPVGPSKDKQQLHLAVHSFLKLPFKI